ncbi:myoD family inhibitor domain-containing protein 2 [Pseudophryne corroboree]|uniref:myoD family inhibitor domain-containing protein 2 n=1 Tax=Pseudophryne corroboree TaxID=495146 RepID=UPI00308187A5
MSETKTNKSKVIFENEQESISWLKEEQNLTSGSREDKCKEKLSQQHKPPQSPDTGDESFQDSNHEKNMRLVTYSSNEECSKILSYKEAKQNAAHQTENEGECASLILACLFCHFCDFLLMLPNACESMVIAMCCPSHRYYHTSDEEHSNNDCNCNCDCGLFDVCQETGDCLELAMEISEVCFH